MILVTGYFIANKDKIRGQEQLKKLKKEDFYETEYPPSRVQLFDHLRRHGYDTENVGPEQIDPIYRLLPNKGV